MSQLFSPLDYRKADGVMHEGCDRRSGKLGFFTLCLGTLFFSFPLVMAAYRLDPSPSDWFPMLMCVIFIGVLWFAEIRARFESRAWRRRCRVLELSGTVVLKECRHETSYSENTGHLDWYEYFLSLRPGPGQLRRDTARFQVGEQMFADAREGDVRQALVVSFCEDDSDLDLVTLMPNG